MPRKIVANLGNSTSGGTTAGQSYVERGAERGRAVDEMEAQRVRAPRLNVPFYKSPCDRNRVTGSAIGIACRLNIQRATAKPIAA